MLDYSSTLNFSGSIEQFSHWLTNGFHIDICRGIVWNGITRLPYSCTALFGDEKYQCLRTVLLSGNNPKRKSCRAGLDFTTTTLPTRKLIKHRMTSQSSLKYTIDANYRPIAEKIADRSWILRVALQYCCISSIFQHMTLLSYFVFRWGS